MAAPIIALFGNPLLDISVLLTNEEVLDKYSLSQNSESEITKRILKSILADIENLSLSAQYGAGGSAQNTARVLQWLLGNPGAVVFVGSIGDDEYGTKMSNIVIKDGVDTRYVVRKDESTGLCVALINGPHRALVAYLGAAVKFTLPDLNEELITQVKMVYIEGFFITKRYDVCQRIISLCQTHKKIFIFNISGSYLLDIYGEQMKELALKSDILFGNDEEYRALGRILNLPEETNSEDVAVYLNKRKRKVAVVTNNRAPVVCVSGDNVVERYEVPSIEKEDVVDTTGAGDAFVAGFMAGFIQEKSIHTCLARGCWTARQIIRKIGCTIPETPPSEIQLNESSF